MCQVPYVYWFHAEASGELYQSLPTSKLQPIKSWIEGLPTECPKRQSARFSFPSGNPPRNAETPSEFWEVEIRLFRAHREEGHP